MATPATQLAGPKKSFASVAAMAPPAQLKQNQTKSDDKVGRFGSPVSPTFARGAPKGSPSGNQPRDELPRAMSRLDLKCDPTIVDGNPTAESNGNFQSGLTLEEDKTQLSCSSTKPPSLDGKSVASGTTFAMDEKESLRPDDSASLKAVEEDDSNSGQASGAPSSRIGSEAGSKAFRDQFNEISERMGPGGQRPMPLPNSRRILQGNADEIPQGPLAVLGSAIPATASIPRPEMASVSGHVPVYNYNYQGPDEKLIEAMANQKDRFFLMALEEQVISFIRDSQEPMLELPPCNSFCRLLAHRLGDYYALTHFVDNAVSAVKLYRTPYCRIPAALSTFVRPQPNSEGSSSAQPSMKIMRRNGLGTDSQNESGPNTATSSMGPSKAGSETGDESQRVSGVTSPTDSAVAKDKAAMTREEREAKYKETRERIFGGAEETQNPESVDPVNNSSRTSSASGKKKSRRNKNNDDDFEARSSYNAYWPTAQYPNTPYNQTAKPMAYYPTYTQPPNSQSPQSGITQGFGQPYQPGAQMQQYPMAVPQPALPSGPVTYPPSYAYTQNNASQPYASYGQQMPQQYYPPMQPQQQMIPQSPAMSSPALSNNGHSRPQSQMSDQHWPQGSYPNPMSYPAFNPQQVSYQPQGQPQVMAQPTTPNASPYPYGQLPFSSNSQPGRSQHPLPGSYNRQAFNPQIRAFIPNAPPFVPPQPAPYSARAVDTSGYRPGPSFPMQSVMTPYVQQPMNNLQLPNTPQIGQYNQLPLGQPFTQPQTQRKTSGNTTRSQSPGQSSLSKWARPENLPPKPPPPEASIKVSNGMQNMPRFQNGTYTKPQTSSQ
ncbi:hypothetical protein MMC30_000661 [Trapelia coarctata]|nr:hypothetical protein [Trapelia coarctata]